MADRPACAAPQLVAAAALTLAAATPCVGRAQQLLTLDAGASYVKYDGYIGAGAVSFTPTLAWHSSLTQLGVRGTVLVFETGHTSVQALIGGAALTRPVAGGPFRFEAAGEAATSSYANVADFSHAVGALRVHAGGPALDAWAGPAGGVISSNGDIAHTVGAALGATGRVPGGTLSGSIASTKVGVLSWSDLDLAFRWSHDAIGVTLSGGQRFAGRYAKQEAFGDAALTWRIGAPLALVLAGGRYPSDPVRGTIAGSYLTLGIRAGGRTGLPVEGARSADRQIRAAAPPADAAAAPAGIRAAVEVREGNCVVTIDAPAAHTVEVMGDFTGWQPVALASAAPGRFTYRLRLASGLFRFNVRADGGPWIAPPGANRVMDEFGSWTAELVVP